MQHAAIILALVLSSTAVAADETGTISRAMKDDQGFFVHEVESPFQAGRTQIRVLLPDIIVSDRKLPVIYILPVEARIESRYGNGLLEIKQQNLHNQHHAIFIAPTFSHLPWYVDHPSDPTIRQETYFLKVVVPFVDKTYSVLDKPENRLLLGFSKSGWGAWSLLLRHPETFGRAAAWDAPLMMDGLGKYGTTDIFGTLENFEKHRLDKHLRARAGDLQRGQRLILSGYGNFHEHHQQAHSLLDELHIPHAYRDGPQRKHDWHSGWVPEAVELLIAPVQKSEAP